jgi:sporulation protein YlmC with PRC-barrel domain
MTDYSSSTRDRDRNRGSDRNSDWRNSDRDRGAFGWNNRDRDRDNDRSSRNDRDRDRDARSRQDQRFGNTDADRRIPINETSRLIASDKVEGTPVYCRNGDRLGSIYNVMIDKRSGQVEYAVMTSGGFLGMGADYKPIPWKMLRYDEQEDGYAVNMSKQDLDRAPGFQRGQQPRFDRDYDIYIYDWYGL